MRNPRIGGRIAFDRSSNLASRLTEEPVEIDRNTRVDLLFRGADIRALITPKHPIADHLSFATAQHRAFFNRQIGDTARRINRLARRERIRWAITNTCHTIHAAKRHLRLMNHVRQIRIDKQGTDKDAHIRAIRHPQ